ALFSQATVRRWFTHTCVDKTRFINLKLPRENLWWPRGAGNLGCPAWRQAPSWSGKGSALAFCTRREPAGKPAAARIGCPTLLQCKYACLSESFGRAFGSSVGGPLHPGAIPENRRHFSLRAHHLHVMSARLEQRDGIGREA